jgi:hypothetical protein
LDANVLAAKVGGTMSTQMVDARRKTRKTVSALRRRVQKFAKSYRLPGPKKLAVLTIFEVIRPALTDSVGSQKTASFVEWRREGVDARRLRCVSALRTETGTLLRRLANTNMNWKTAIAATITCAAEKNASAGPRFAAPPPMETLSMIETQ